MLTALVPSVWMIVTTTELLAWMLTTDSSLMLRVVAAAGAATTSVVVAVVILVLVRPGGRMPVDGVVTNGQSEVDRAILTGESLPVFAGPGSMVAAGETNLTGPLTVRVTHAGQDSSLHRMAQLVAVAETARHRYTALADRAAQIYAPAVHILATGDYRKPLEEVAPGAPEFLGTNTTFAEPNPPAPSSQPSLYIHLPITKYFFPLNLIV